MIGSVIKGIYRIYDEVGMRELYTMYLARDTQRNRIVALKVIHQDLAKETQFVERFQQEARVLAKLDSPHIVRIYDYGKDNDVSFVVLDYVEGKPLSTIIEEQGRLEIRDALNIARQVAEGLKAAHEKNIVHMDIKPDNIMVEPDGLVKIIDFGIAGGIELSRLSLSGVVGTPDYLSRANRG